MSRNELRVIARIVLIGAGLYVLLETFLRIFLSFAEMPFVETKRIPIPVIIIALVIYIVTTLAIVYFLVRSANRLSDKNIENETIDDTQISGIAVAFRLVYVIVGVLFIYWTIPNLIVTVLNYIMNMNTTDKSGLRTIYIGMSSITEIVKYIFLLGLGIYLAFGAPAFVRWQVRRTLKQCGKIEEQKSTLG